MRDQSVESIDRFLDAQTEQAVALIEKRIRFLEAALGKLGQFDPLESRKRGFDSMHCSLEIPTTHSRTIAAQLATTSRAESGGYRDLLPLMRKHGMQLDAFDGGRERKGLRQRRGVASAQWWAGARLLADISGLV